MTSPQPLAVQRAIAEGYLRYVDTAFWLRDESLRAERRSLLEEAGTLFTEPLLEPVMPYDPAEPIAAVCAEAGLPGAIAGTLASMLFPPNDESFPLRAHQADALRVSLAPATAPERNIVITSGTGSGKTEAFLLPVLARLLAEAESWPKPEPLHRWWEAGKRQEAWKPARSASARPPAVRAMILYPTNALVEDQISRLRRALISLQGRVSSPPSFFFGRYTGATLGGGALPSRSTERLVEEVAEELRQMERDRERMGTDDPELISQFSDPRVGELLARWDMIQAPPDILVTNYSMLNVMLMREREDPIFDHTALWLAESSEHAFTLVVDELHSYRGTQGSEVALVLRNFLRRIRLDPDSPQLRCIGTSASLSDSEGREYLEEFFGVPGETFRITAGSPRLATPADPLPRARFSDLGRDTGPEQYKEALRAATAGLSISKAVAAACLDGTSTRATTLSELDKRVFDTPPNGDISALEAVLDALADPDPDADSIPFRAHLFVRQMPGVWACRTPSAQRSQVRTDGGSESSTQRQP